MKKHSLKKLICTALAVIMAISCASAAMVAGAEISTTYYDGVKLVENSNGLVLGYHENSGVTILVDEESGYKFKDMNRNGQLDVYEDWRNPVEDRAADLVSQMGLAQMFGLMSHGGAENANGIKQGYRFNLVRNISSKSGMAETNNQLQMTAETEALGIPVIISTDPRHSGTIDSGTNEVRTGVESNLSAWPTNYSIASTFSEEALAEYGDIMAAEFRAYGITTLLGPQLDLNTEPRWSRVSGALTEDYDLNADLGAALITAMQTSDKVIEDYPISANGWGSESVVTMAKHWPSGGNGEFGYDSHKDWGKFAVYPSDTEGTGESFRAAMDSFARAAGIGEESNGKSNQAGGIMPYYTICYDQDPSGANVGNGFSKYIITDLLRGEYKYDGYACTDWGIVTSGGMADCPWGLEGSKGYTTPYRYLAVIMAGVDQIGGKADLSILQEAYDMGANGSEFFGIEGIGEEAMTARIREAAKRILISTFNLGLFENPYTDPVKAEEVVGSAEFNAAAYETHKKSVVMVKNHNDTLPLGADEKLTAYIPVTVSEKSSGGGWGGFPGGGFPGGGFPGGEFPGGGSSSTTEEDEDKPKEYTASASISLDLVKEYYNLPGVLEDVVANPAPMTDEQKQAAADEADFAIVKIDSPGVDFGAVGKGQTLQYGVYNYHLTREVSIGGDWYHEDGTILQFNETPDESKGDYKENRTVLGNPTNDNTSKITTLLETIELMNGKPVIVILNMANPTCVGEFEGDVAAILTGNSVTNQAYLEVIAGEYEPTGLLSCTMPKDMEAVELQNEDIPDTDPYVDEDGNVYEFGYGLNYSGRIADDRTAKYIGLEPEEPAVISAPEEVKTGEEFDVKFTLEAGCTGIRLVNEKGSSVTITGASIDNSTALPTWTISTKIGTAGTGRTLSIYGRIGGEYVDTGLKVTLDVVQATETTGKKAEVKSARFLKSNVAKNEAVKAEVATSSNAAKVAVLNEKGAKMGKTLVSKTVSGDSATWVLETSIGSSGSRMFTFAAAKTDGVYNYDKVGVATIIVK